jgi:hypothetical protein
MGGTFRRVSPAGHLGEMVNREVLRLGARRTPQHPLEVRRAHDPADVAHCLAAGAHGPAARIFGD